MGEPAREPMTADEFLVWDDGTDTRHELVDGVVIAMAPPTDAHGTIAGNVWGEINGRLEDRPPCRAVMEAGIRLDDGNHYEADVAATCAEPRGERFLAEPFLVVEVLSESTGDRDLGGKTQRYLELPHLREIGPGRRARAARPPIPQHGAVGSFASAGPASTAAALALNRPAAPRPGRAAPP